ncbi:MAG: hypothetical protein LBC67_08020 [Spirochaetales bacterium]|jgi:hypothetical protein|nr:hypothetical protein [Spirochaetales bacterium]
MGRIHSAVLYAGAAWETVKFFFLFRMAAFALNPERNHLVNLLLLWLASARLCVGLLFFLGGYMPERFACLRKVTAVFICVGALPPFLFLINDVLPALAFRLGAGEIPRLLPPEALPFPLAIAVPACIIIGIDALFLAFLVLFSPERKRGAVREENSGEPQ